MLIYCLSFIAVFVVPWCILHFAYANTNSARHCEEFVRKNPGVIKIVGDVRKVRVSAKTLFSAKENNTLIFRVYGNRGKEYFYVRQIAGQVQEITKRVGFDNRYTVWPEIHDTMPTFWLPSHIYDGLILLGLGLLTYILSQSAKKDGPLFNLMYPKSLRLAGTTNHEGHINFLFSSGFLVIMGLCCLLNLFTML